MGVPFLASPAPPPTTSARSLGTAEVQHLGCGKCACCQQWAKAWESAERPKSLNGAALAEAAPAEPARQLAPGGHAPAASAAAPEGAAGAAGTPAQGGEVEQLSLSLKGASRMEIRAPKPRRPAPEQEAGQEQEDADRSKRPRQSPGDTIELDGSDSEVEMLPQQIVSKPADKPQVLRISAGRAAAAVGIHPYADIGETFLEFLYQDMPELLLRDAALAGAEVVSPVAERARLLEKSGEARSIEAAIASAAKSVGLEGAQAAQEAIKVLLKVAENTGRLTSTETEELQSSLGLEINLEFGSRHEDAAIDAYSAQVGKVVYGQQKRISISLPSGAPADALATVFPAPGSFPGEAAEVAAAAKAAEDRAKQAGAEGGAARSSSSSYSEAYFRLTGFVDGMVDLPQGLDGNLNPCVVEVKHRMNKIKDPPEIYDIVQLGSYCRALGCTRGQLVQCLRRGASKTSVGTLTVTDLDFSEGSRDRQGWDRHVLPGLYSMAAAVYATRKDLGLRLRLLTAPDQRQREELVRSICPHLG